MSATNPTTAPARSGLSVIKGLLLLLIGAGAGYLTCWYAKVEPAKAEVKHLATLLGPGSSAGTGTEATTVARLESGIRSLQDERDAEHTKVREAEAANEVLRTGAAASTKERDNLRAQLETSRQGETALRTELATCEELGRTKDEALSEARLDLADAEQRCARTVSERDELTRAMQALQKQRAEPPPLELAPIESGWHGSPSTLTKRAQSAEVREALSPLLAKGLHQPFRQATSSPLPFSLRALEESGALDRSNPESLFNLWSLVVAHENDRADKWPNSWAPVDTAGWLENWFRSRADDAIPILDRAQRLLIELGPALVELRMLAP